MAALKNPYARENELILLSARPGRDDDDVGRIEQLLGDDIDWTYLIRTALLHKVVPALGVNSTYRCNTLVKSFCRCFIA